MQPAVPSGTDDAGNEADVSLSDHLSLRLLNKKSYSVGEVHRTDIRRHCNAAIGYHGLFFAPFLEWDCTEVN